MHSYLQPDHTSSQGCPLNIHCLSSWGPSYMRAHHPRVPPVFQARLSVLALEHWQEGSKALAYNKSDNHRVLDSRAIEAAVVEFAIQQFPLAVGLQQQFSKQLKRRAGVTALIEYSISRRDAAKQDDQSAVARRRGYWETRKGLPPGVTNREFYYLAHGSDLDTARLQMHKLLELHMTKLLHGDTALQVLLPSRVEEAASVERTHNHIGYSDPHISGPVEVELVTAYHPSFVAVLASVDLRDEAEVSLRNLKFHFGENEVENLEVDNLEWNGPNDPVYQLESGPLQSITNVQDSIRPIFTDHGFIPKTDVVVETGNEAITRKIVVRCDALPAWLQKLTAVNGGHEDQEIEAYPVRWCTLCQPIAMQHQRPENPVEAAKTPAYVNRRTVLGNVIDRMRRYDGRDSLGSGQIIPVNNA